MKFVILGVGSNRSWMGNNSLELLRKACSELAEFVSDFKISSVYRTKPMYLQNQDSFLNMVLCGFVKDDITPQLLLEKIHKIEASLGRNRKNEVRNGPRSIDIDIEIFDKIKVSSSNLEIPHPRLKERAFVLIPILEIFEECADFIDRDEFVFWLKQLDVSDVEKILPKEEFLKKNI